MLFVYNSHTFYLIYRCELICEYDRFSKRIFVSLIVFFVCSLSAISDFAVTTKARIIFYGTNFQQITTAAHQFDTLTAIALDETEDTLYFNDQQHTDGTIFSLKLSSNGDHRVEKLVEKTRDELIQGMAFDSLKRILYWTDAKNNIIYQLNVDERGAEPSILLKLDEQQSPHGIALDVCRRQLYWTNANHLKPTIERIPLDGPIKSEVLIDMDLFMPFGIVVDQYTKRLYWVDDKLGIRFSVESAKLDGTDRQNVTQRRNSMPFNLAVDETNVFWTDTQYNAIWRISKNATHDEEPQKVTDFGNVSPKGIIVRNSLLSRQKANPECKSVWEKIMMPDATQSSADESMTIGMIPKHFCLNGGDLNPKTNLCICSHEFKGAHCEIKICHNYCLDGTCHISSTGIAQCECHAGFEGKRCEINKCTGYCLNEGRCDLENNEPVCHCASTFYGDQCQSMEVSEICNRYCNDEEVDAKGINLSLVCNK